MFKKVWYIECRGKFKLVCSMPINVQLQRIALLPIIIKKWPTTYIFIPIMLNFMLKKIRTVHSLLSLFIYKFAYVNKSLLIAGNLETVLLGRMYKWQQNVLVRV